MISTRAVALWLWSLCFALTQPNGALASAVVHRRAQARAISRRAHQPEDDDEPETQDKVEEAANEINMDVTAEQEEGPVEEQGAEAETGEQSKPLDTAAEKKVAKDTPVVADKQVVAQQVAENPQAQKQKAPMSMVAAAKQSGQQAEPDLEAQTDATEAEHAEVDAMNAKEAASVAKQAATVANKVAEHSINVTKHAKSALKHALGALHDARVDSKGLSGEQKESLKKAEGQLREATKKADYGKLKHVGEKSQTDIKKEAMQDKLAKKAPQGSSELQEMREELHQLREAAAAKVVDKETAEELEELEDELDKIIKAGGKTDGTTTDELKAEIERLRDIIDKLPEDDEAKDKELMKDVHMKPLDANEGEAELRTGNNGEATPIEDKGIDIDTQMPYGDLEPFGREDTAQELTESSVRESDGMVDQLERAEVAEEKRSVFRALTRLRGAAITSFDGVARSQTGNIDEYNKVHKWRKTHPLHHLADEESDVAKWAFPDNAD